MSTANDPVSAALEQALSGGQEAVTQSAADPSPEAKPTAPSDAKVEGTKESTDPKVESKTVPYDRFSEVVSQKNEAVERIKSLESLFEGVTKRDSALSDRIGELEGEHQILEAIRNLAGDERYRSHVMALDKALQGIEDEVTEAKEQGDDKALSQAEARLTAKQKELEDLIADQNAESLWETSTNLASKLIDALPEEYTDVDKARISAMWTPRVDWNHIEETGREGIMPELQKTLAELIKDYGAPQGVITKQAREETLKNVPQAAEANLSPEQKVEKILGRDWSKVEEGKPVESHDDFRKAVADLVRVTRNG